MGASVFAEPVVDERYVYYDVHGDTAEALLQQIEAERGPDGFHAETNWLVTWRYGWQSTSSECRIVDVQIEVDIEYLMPRWQNREEVFDQALVDTWNRYELALRVHEQGHGDIAIEAGKAVEATLFQMLPRHDCKRLSADADALAMHVIDQHQEQNQDYDDVTDHGATQGAVFP